MTTIHFINVGDGDCILMEHASGRTTLLDICGGNRARRAEQKMAARHEKRKAAGNFRMCEAPVNPLDYLGDCNIGSLWRFISSHPDMDHLDGLVALFDEYAVKNFWYSGVEKEKPEFEEDVRWREEDWDLYEQLTAGEVSDTTSLTKSAGAQFKYANRDEDGSLGGDYMDILSPGDELIGAAEESGNFNDASYVLRYRSAGGRIVFPGDAHDKTWKFILDESEVDLSDTRLLTAPHHGRHSDRSFDFLDELEPELTFFGCAPSDTLAYDAWRSRGLDVLTTNQAGCIVAECANQEMEIFVENESYAEKEGGDTSRTNRLGFYYLRTLSA